MSRPTTSRPRGLCRFYNTRHGCCEGDNCKFLHGADETLTPYDKSKICKFFAAGYCIRGSSCWFRHVVPEQTAVPASSSLPLRDNDAEACSVCYEKPVTYGLLTGCSHVFCIKCIRDWRDRTGKGEEVVQSGNIKKCPMCRQSSRFIIPSSIFYAEGTPGKDRALENYKASMARVPCKHFEKFGRTFCPFGKDCFYQHLSADGTPHILPYGVDDNPRRRGPIPRRGFMDDLEWTLGFGFRPELFNIIPEPSRPVEPLFEDPMQDLRATIEHIRASLPQAAFRDQSFMSDEDEGYGMEAEEVQALADRLFATLHRVTEMQRGGGHAAPAGTSLNRVAEVGFAQAAPTTGEDEVEPRVDILRLLDQSGEGHNDNPNEGVADHDDDDELPSLESIEAVFRSNALEDGNQSGRTRDMQHESLPPFLPRREGTLQSVLNRSEPGPFSSVITRFSTILPGRLASEAQPEPQVGMRAWAPFAGEDTMDDIAGTLAPAMEADADPVDDSTLTPYDNLLLRESARAIADADALSARAAAVLRDTTEGAPAPPPIAPPCNDVFGAQEAPPVAMPAAAPSCAAERFVDRGRPLIADSAQEQVPAGGSTDDVWEAQQNSNPPFKTDGRGKVVFASAAAENSELDGIVESRRRKHTRS